MHSYSKILGIDFGTQRIGLAVSFGTLAEPLEIIANNGHTFDALQEILKREGIQKIVVGVSEGAMAQLSQAFAAQVEEKFGLPVLFVDETLTTKQVEAKIKEAGTSRRFKRVDHLAAAEMLQEWLDTQS